MFDKKFFFIYIDFRLAPKCCILLLIIRNEVHNQGTYSRKYDLAQKCSLKHLMLITFTLGDVDMKETLGSEPNYERSIE